MDLSRRFNDMKKILLIVSLFIILMATAAYAYSQVGNPVAQVAPSPSTISLQVWAKSWKEEDCGKWYALAIAERQQKTPNVMLGMTDTNLFWACMEVNRQVNAATHERRVALPVLSSDGP